MGGCKCASTRTISRLRVRGCAPPVRTESATACATISRAGPRSAEQRPGCAKAWLSEGLGCASTREAGYHAPQPRTAGELRRRNTATRPSITGRYTSHSLHGRHRTNAFASTRCHKSRTSRASAHAARQRTLPPHDHRIATPRPAAIHIPSLRNGRLNP